MLDASRLHLADFWRRFRAAMAVLALVGLAIAISVDLTIGLWMLFFGLLSLALTWIHTLDAWILRRSGRGYIGEMTEYLADEQGIHYSGPIGSGLVPWSRITSLRVNAKSIAFGRDRVLAAWVPTNAFDSPAERDAFVAYARAHVTDRNH
jgi:YcxB-like protein